MDSWQRHFFCVCVFSVAFVATQNILLKASNLFWFFPKDKSLFVRKKINGLQ